MVTAVVIAILLVVLIIVLRDRRAKKEVYAACYNLCEYVGEAKDGDCDGRGYCVLECEGCPYWNGHERYDK